MFLPTICSHNITVYLIIPDQVHNLFKYLAYEHTTSHFLSLYMHIPVAIPALQLTHINIPCHVGFCAITATSKPCIGS